MAVLADAVKTLLNNDATLAATLTGKVLDSEDFGRNGLTAESAPKETNNVTIKPFAHIVWATEIMTAWNQLNAGRLDCEIYIYQHSGYRTIDVALWRINTLLHLQTVLADDVDSVHFERILVSQEFRAEEVANAPNKLIRFEVLKKRT